MKTNLTACCVSMILLAGTAFASPHNGSPNQMANKSQSMQNVQSIAKNQAIQQNLPKFSSNKFASPKKFDPAFKLTKFKSPNKIANYNLKFGKTFAFGTYYAGKHHHHWSSYGWWSQFRCYVYWDPCVLTYYYWCDADQCFYPIAYAETVAPTANMPLIDLDNAGPTGAPTANVGLPAPPAE